MLKNWMKKLAKEGKLDEVPENYRDQAKKWSDNLRHRRMERELTSDLDEYDIDREDEEYKKLIEVG